LADAPIEVKKTAESIDVFYDWQKQTFYTLIVLPNAITSIFGQTNDSLELGFQLRPEAEYGDLTIKIENFETLESPETYFYELRTPDGMELGRGTVQDSLIQFKQLISGKYNFLVTEDLNQNGKWDSGDYLSRKQPERIFTPEGGISVKTSWETEIPMVIE